LSDGRAVSYLPSVVFAAADTFTAWATVGLGMATLLIAAFTLLAVREAQADRRLTQQTLLAQARPALLQAFVAPEITEEVAVHAPGSLSAYGSIPVHRGQPIVMAGTPFGAQVCVCSVVVRNGGRGPAEILSARLMSLDTAAEGDGPQYVTAFPRVNILGVHDWTRIDADLLPVAPPWFWRTVKNLNKMWFEVTYADFDRINRETRWFELSPHPADNSVWRNTAILSARPQPTLRHLTMA
jgi:hypothetical protein